MDKIKISYMERWEIIRYNATEKEHWNKFVEKARNATFLFNRNYMDYHADRFADYSLMAFRNGKLSALLPANITLDKTLHSHQGLTYGGWILPEKHIDAVELYNLWTVWIDFCKKEGIKQIDYKPLPFIYTKFPSQDDEYALYQSNAIATEVNLSSTIDLSCIRGFNKMMERQLAKAGNNGLSIVEYNNVDTFWQILEECLKERHNTRPVHTSDEIKHLISLFPDNIRIFATTDRNGNILAGTCIYDTGRVIHTQYIASTVEGREYHALPLLFDNLINRFSSTHKYLDFGISNEGERHMLNFGLLRQKASLGGGGVAYRRYLLKVI
jgi:hypothetical protein